MNKKYVVIGSSSAGIAAVSTLRELDHESHISVFSSEKEWPYNKCFLPDYIAGDKQREQLFIRDRIFFERQRIEAHFGVCVTTLDATQQIIGVEDGRQFDYDYLLIATGARAVRTSIKNSTVHGVFFFYQLSDIDLINLYREENGVKNVVVIGAGLTGIECADAFQIQGMNVTIVDAHAHLLAKHINYNAAQIIEHCAQEVGINFVFDAKVEEIIVADNKVYGVRCSNQQEIKTDMIIIAAGELPNCEIAAQAGLRVAHNGIVTNAYLQTSVPTIFAAGDVAQVNDLKSGELVRSFKWSDAANQGTIAAHNMVGNQRIYPGIVRVSGSYFFGARFFVVGNKDAPGEQIIFHDEKTKKYAAVTMHNEKIVAAMLYGHESAVSFVRRAFTQNLQVTENLITEWLIGSID